MDEGNLAILVDAKTEYTKQLVNIISPNIFKGIKNIYNNAKINSLNNDILFIFQENLSQIPKWNQEVINEHYYTLVKSSNCDWLEDLLTAVFVSHTRILTSINFNKNKNKINLKIPKVDHFIHLCYIEVARKFWKNPYLFDDTISKFEYQRNRRDSEKIIDNTINETIRKQLPVKHILKEYLGTEFKEANTDFTISENNSEHENLRKMVKAEIENCSKEKLDKLNINSLDLEYKEEVNVNKNTIKDFDDLVKNNNENELDLNEKSNNVSFVDKQYDLVKEASALVKEESPVVKEDSTLVKEYTTVVKEDSTLKEDTTLVKEDSTVKQDSALVEEDPTVKEDSTLVKEDSTLVKEDSTVKQDSALVEEDPTVVKDNSIEFSKEIIKPSDNEISELETVKMDELNNLSNIELDVENTINNEITDLKIETLNLDIDDDLSNLDEIYIDTPNNKLSNLNENLNENENENENYNDNNVMDIDYDNNVIDIEYDNNVKDIDNKIKTVYIDTSEKTKKKNTFNETDIEINYDNDLNYKKKKYSKQDFNFFN